jgi:hypothetical protein
MQAGGNAMKHLLRILLLSSAGVLVHLLFIGVSAGFAGAPSRDMVGLLAEGQAATGGQGACAEAVLRGSRWFTAGVLPALAGAAVGIVTLLWRSVRRTDLLGVGLVFLVAHVFTKELTFPEIVAPLTGALLFQLCLLGVFCLARPPGESVRQEAGRYGAVTTTRAT